VLILLGVESILIFYKLFLCIKKEPKMALLGDFIEVDIE
jgi:hypothetical protein